MVEQSDLYRIAKTSMETSCSEPTSTLQNYRKIADQVSVDPNRIQNLTQIAIKSLQNGEKDLAVWYIDFLDYLTATCEQVFCPFVDNAEFLENILRLALQFHIIHALRLVVYWEPFITANINLVLKKKVELAVSSSEFKEALKSRPQLKYAVSRDQKIKGSVNAARTELNRLSYIENLDFSLAENMSQLKEAIAKLTAEETKILALIKDEPPKSDSRKALERVQDELREKISEFEGFLEENLAENDQSSKVSSREEVEGETQKGNSKTATGDTINRKSANDEEAKRLSDEDGEGKNRVVNLSNIDPKIAASMLTIEELLKYKLFKCPNAECPYRPSKEKTEKFKNKDLICPFWHFDYDKRREVIQQTVLSSPQPTGVKTEYHAKMCEKKGCRFKEKCFFSHNFFESYYHPLYYKKFSCEENLGKECDKNKYCPYVHKKEEEDCWTEILKARVGIDRNKPHKPVDAENEKLPDVEADAGISRTTSAGSGSVGGNLPKKTKSAAETIKRPTSKIEPPPGKILEKPEQSAAAQKKEIVQENPTGSPEAKLKGFKGKDKKDGGMLKLSSQPFGEPGKKEDKAEGGVDLNNIRPTSTPPTLTTTNNATSLQAIPFLDKKDRKSSDERERKRNGHKKDGQKALEKGPMDENVATRAFFIENEEIPIANKQRFQFITKIKELKKPKAITKSICGMLNTEGGWIFLGFEETGRVTGVPMKFEERDQFKQTVINSLQRFSPKPGNNDYSISFIEVRNQSNEPITDLYVIKLQIKKADTKNFFCNEKEEYYHRSEAGKNEKYTPKQVQDEIIRRRAPFSNIPANPQVKDLGSSQPLSQSTGGTSSTSTMAGSLPGQSVQQPMQQSNPQSSSSQQPTQQYPGSQPFPQNYPPPFLGPNFPQQNPFAMGGGFNPFASSPFQVPQGTFVLFVPYNPYQPNSIAQFLSSLLATQGMSVPPTTNTTNQNSSETKSDENKVPDPNIQFGNPPPYNPFGGPMSMPPLQNPQFQNLYPPNFNQSQGMKSTSGPSQTSQTSGQRDTHASNIQKPQIQQQPQQSMPMSSQKTQQHGYMPSYNHPGNLMNPSMMTHSQGFNPEAESSNQIPGYPQRQSYPGYPSFYPSNYPSPSTSGSYGSQSQNQSQSSNQLNQQPNISHMGPNWGGPGQNGPFFSPNTNSGPLYGYGMYPGMNQNMGQTLKYGQDSETSKNESKP